MAPTTTSSTPATIGDASTARIRPLCILVSYRLPESPRSFALTSRNCRSSNHNVHATVTTPTTIISTPTNTVVPPCSTQKPPKSSTPRPPDRLSRGALV